MNKIMKNKKLIIMISVLAVLLVGGLLAYLTDTLTVTNKITTGIVDIELNEYTKDANDNEIAWTDKTNIKPGETVSKIAKINATATSEPCYIRAKLTFTCEDATLNASAEMPSVADLNLDIPANWVLKADGYYYYNTKVNPSDVVTLFTQFTLPNTLNNDWSNQTFDLDVKADAIQADNFTLNMAATAPWGTVTEAQIIPAN